MDGDLKQGHEDVLQHLLKAGQLLLGMVDITLEERGRKSLFYYNIQAIWYLEIVQTYSNSTGEK